MTSEIDPFYNIYKDAGFIPIEIGINGFLFSIAFVGICFNLCLIWVTIKAKELHSPCNILIGLYAFFASFLLIGTTIKFFVFLFGFNYISLRSCFCLQIAYFVGANFAIYLQLFIAIDRFVGIAFPFWYNSRGKYRIFKFAFCFSFSLTLIYLVNIYNVCSKHWEKQVMCGIADLGLMPENLATAFPSIGIYFCEFFCYLAIWALILCRKEHSKEDPFGLEWDGRAVIPIAQNGKKFIVSLSVIMTVNFSCFFTTTIFILLIIPILKIDVFTSHYSVVPICNAFYFMANGSSAPILCFCSELYRNAFRKVFRKSHQENAVQYLPNLNNNNNNNNN